MTLSGAVAGGAIAPGAALTVDNPGTGAAYPVTNWSAMTGVMPFTGAYSTSLLGGTPSHVQAQVSATPSGAAVSRMHAMLWTNVSSEVISGGDLVWEHRRHSGWRSVLGFIPGGERRLLRHASQRGLCRGEHRRIWRGQCGWFQVVGTASQTPGTYITGICTMVG